MIQYLVVTMIAAPSFGSTLPTIRGTFTEGVDFVGECHEISPLLISDYKTTMSDLGDGIALAQHLFS